MRLLISLLAGCVAVAANAASFEDILEQTWLRYPPSQAVAARQDEAAAQGAIASGWLAAPPVLGAQVTSDRLTENRGFQELEAELALPLWWPGERTARAALAHRESESVTAASQALRLELAGKLREAAWAVKLAEAEHRLAQQRESDAARLKQDVSRRVKAGALGSADALLARDEAVTARQATLEKAIELQEARRAYRQLTGTDELPSPLEEAAAVAPDEHPERQAARAAAAAAEGKVRLAGKALNERPALLLGAKYDRAEYGQDGENTLRIGIAIPLGGDRFRRPEVAAAQAELSEAAATQALADDRLPLAVATAQTQLTHETERLAAARERQAIAREHLELLQKSFDLGFLDLPTLLRTRSSAAAAELDFTRQQLRVARARARLNQAQGVLP
ncbi:MAG: TolC family protein [Candidatus Contendobacter sp.]|jgi:outer membrane protein, heavy metal efflux system|nr:TolC family protein [Candidatus Contendobacter sp.]